MSGIRNLCWLGALAGLVACRLDQLVTPPTPVRLVVFPKVLADSAFVGSPEIVRDLTIQIDRTGGVSWRATTAVGSPWLTLRQTGSAAPGTLSLSLGAISLAPGTYQDTVVVIPDGWDGQAVRVPVTFTVTVRPRPVSASRSTLVASAATITASNGTITTTLTVTARDEEGVIMAGVPVELAVSGSGNTLKSASGTTGANGVFTASLSSTRAEIKVVSAAAGGIVVSQQRNIAVNAAAPTALVFAVQPSNARVNQYFSPAVTVTARDAFGNTARGFTGNITVNIGADASSSGNADLKGQQTVKASNGSASFGDLRIDRTGNGYTLTAAASGLAGATSERFNVTLL